jgi:hypothetical protein
MCLYHGSLREPFFFMGYGAFWFWKERQSRKRHSTVPPGDFEERCLATFNIQL